METFLAAGSSSMPGVGWLTGLSGFIAIKTYVVVAAGLILRIFLAGMVSADAHALSRRKEGLAMGNNIIWSFAVLFGGVWAVLVYWLINRSSLRQHPNGSTTQQPDVPVLQPSE